MMKIIIGVIVVIVLGVGGLGYWKYQQVANIAQGMIEKQSIELQRRVSGEKKQVVTKEPTAEEIEILIEAAEAAADKRKKPFGTGIDPAYQKAMHDAILKRAQETYKAQPAPVQKQGQ